MARNTQAKHPQNQRNFSLYLNACLPDDMPAKPSPTPEIFSLIECPAVAFGTRYKFVSIVRGQRITVAIGRAQSKYASLNLAAIRRRGARLGVQEVHILR